MNPRVKKVVLVLQDLKTKEGETVAIVSLDVHTTTRDKKKIISAQALLDDNKELARVLKGLVNEALVLNDTKDK
jgi:hypothetical protein